MTISCRNIKCLVPKIKRNISNKNMDECICWKKTNEEKEIYEDILGKEIISRNQEREGQKYCYGSSLVATIQL